MYLSNDIFSFVPFWVTLILSKFCYSLNAIFENPLLPTISLTEFLVLHGLFLLDLSPRCSVCSSFPCHCMIYSKILPSLQNLYFQRRWDSEEKKILYYRQAMKIKFSRLSHRAPLKFLPSTQKFLTDFPLYSHHNFKFCHPRHPWSDRNLILLNCWETLNRFHSYLILNSHLSYLLFHLDIYQVTAWTSPTLCILMLLFAMSTSQLKQWVHLRQTHSYLKMQPLLSP